MRGDFFMTEAYYLPREQIAPVQKIAVVGANFSRPNNGGAIFSQMVFVNKWPGRKILMLSSSACMKNRPPLLGAIFSLGRKSHVTPVFF